MRAKWWEVGREMGRALRGVTRSRRLSRNLAKLMVQRLARSGSAFLGFFFAVCLVVWLLERDVEGAQITTFIDAVWFGICTISTVGYGDTYPVTTAGRTIVGLFILFTMISIGFLLTAINDVVIEVKTMEEKGLLGTEFDGHIIVCGFSPVARSAIEELLAADRDVAVICERNEDLPLAQRFGPRPNFYATAGDLDQEVMRDRLGAERARTAVVATEEDTANIIAALNLRAVNPSIRVVVAVKTEELRQTLIASGVTYVASPFELSGRLVASAAFEPEVARFVDEITTGIGGFDMQQFPAEPFAGQTVDAVRRTLIAAEGPLLVGIASWVDGSFELRPHPRQDYKIDKRDQLLVLANETNSRRMAEIFKVVQGR